MIPVVMLRRTGACETIRLEPDLAALRAPATGVESIPFVIATWLADPQIARARFPSAFGTVDFHGLCNVQQVRGADWSVCWMLGRVASC